MTIPFVAQLRSRPGVIRLGSDGQPRITIRVQLAEAWDTVRVETPPTEPVSAVKAEALAALRPNQEPADEFVVKLNGFEVLDENVSVADSGATNGSTFLLSYRRRRPVR
ncbi:MAG TPA: DUF2604 domain-containing protein [Gemmatimonadaceae bacterium]|nr:DUF2604 domain-containing protein [Gemmatimonadaceae bacterium]